MGLNASKIPTKGGLRQPTLEPGPYPARLVKVIGLGLQEQSYLGQAKDPAYEISLAWELLDAFCVDEDDNIQEDKPRWLSETMPLHNLGAERAKSTQRYLALDPNQVHGGDWAQLLGSPCMVTIVNNPGRGKNADRVFNNVGNVAPMREKDVDDAPQLLNESVVFDLDSPDLEIFNAQPDFLKSKITSNLEYNGSELQSMLGQTPSDEAANEDTEGDTPNVSY